MMNSLNIVWGEELASNQMFRTCRASVEGEECIVKRISIPEEQLDKISAVKEKLGRQLEISRKISPEDKGSIVLYERCEEYTTDQGQREVLYIRPFIQGTVLSDLLRDKGFLAEEKAVKIILAIGRVIVKAHGYDLYHGDLKPENIIVRDDGSVAVIDWDTMSAKKEIQGDVSGGRTLAYAEMVTGTPQYMAPEQFETLKSSEKADVYALGMILCKMLTGKTPFDELRLDEILEKKREPVTSLPVNCTNSGNHISEDLSNIVVGALCVDPNSRTQTAAFFVDEIADLLVVLPENREPEPSTVPESPSPSPEQKNSESYDLVLVGHKSAGKTVLAAGLSATTSGEFFVEPKDPQTRTFADIKKALLSTHKWPDGTLRQRLDLAFTLYSDGKSADIRFKEYAGEALNTRNYCRDYLKSPDGVLLLLNPGIMKEEELRRRNKESAINDCVTYLCGLPKPPPIALVITASDRLNTDLREQAADFRKIVQRIEYSMESKKAVWAEFEVSVTGELKDQREPVLNPKGVQEPFVWILSQIGRKDRLRRSKKYLVAALILLCALVLSALGRYFVESREVGRIPAEIAADARDYTGHKGVYKSSQDSEEDRLRARVTQLAKIRAARCAAGHIRGEGEDVGSRVESCSPECSPYFFFGNLERRFKEEIDKLDIKVDEANNTLWSTKLENIVKAWNRPDFDLKTKADDIETDIRKWVPLSKSKGKELKNALEKELGKKLPRTREKHCFSVCRATLEAIIKNPKNRSFEVISSSIKELPAGTVLPQDERQREDDEIARLRLQAEQAIFDHKTESIRRELREMSGNASVSQWTDLAVKVLKFLEMTKELCPEIKGLGAENRKTEELLKAGLNSCVDHRCKEYRDSQLKTASKLQPDFKDEFVSKLFPVLPREWQEEFAKVIDDSVSATQNTWDGIRRDKVQGFINLNRGKSALDAISALSQFCYEGEMDNPHLAEAEDVILEKSHQFISDFLERVLRRDISNQDFLDTKELCASLTGARLCKVCPALRRSPLYGWAGSYVSWKNQNRKFSVRFGALQAKVHYSNPDEPYFRSFSCHKISKAGARKISDYSSRWGFTTRFNAEQFTSFRDPEYWPPKAEDFVVGDSLVFKADIWDCRGDDWSAGKVSRTFFPGIEAIAKTVDLNDPNSKVTVRLNLEVSGMPFDSWLKKNPFPVQR